MTTKAEFNQLVLSGINRTIAKLQNALEEDKNKIENIHNASVYWFELHTRITRLQKDIKRLEESKIKYQ